LISLYSTVPRAEQPTEDRLLAEIEAKYRPEFHSFVRVAAALTFADSMSCSVSRESVYRSPTMDRSRRLAANEPLGDSLAGSPRDDEDFCLRIAPQNMAICRAYADRTASGFACGMSA
jgi:hypothetical protein